MGHTSQGGQDPLAEALPTEVVFRDRRVLDHVMEDCHDLRRFALHGDHDRERVEEVRLADLVLLPLVRSERVTPIENRLYSRLGVTSGEDNHWSRIGRAAAISSIPRRTTLRRLG